MKRWWSAKSSRFWEARVIVGHIVNTSLDTDHNTSSRFPAHSSALNRRRPSDGGFPVTAPPSLPPGATYLLHVFGLGGDNSVCNYFANETCVEKAEKQKPSPAPTVT